MTQQDRIVLIGMMGAGKTTIGLAISQTTGWPYIDNDEIVAQISGMPTRDLLRQRGEPAMREAEFAAVDKVLACAESRRSTRLSTAEADLGTAPTPQEPEGFREPSPEAHT